jgi:hypothetical protein
MDIGLFMKRSACLNPDLLSEVEEGVHQGSWTTVMFSIAPGSCGENHTDL